MISKNVAVVDLTSIKISPELFKVLPDQLMKRHLMLPFDLQGKRLSLAMANPDNEHVIDQIRTMTGYELEFFAANPEIISSLLQRHFNAAETAPFRKELEIQASSTDSGIIRTVDKLFELALQYRASDIHLEPQIKSLFVRFRIDGALQTIHQFPQLVSVGILSRIKVMASMDITERRLPQDGQIEVAIQGREIDLRISTLPGKYGEKMVVRLLDKSAGAVDLSELGTDPVAQGHFEMMVDKPQGLVLVTGPTGSGKTTTLYAVLERLKSPLKNIITFEDPIEYEMLASCENETGITQVQINPKIGLTFAAGLRSSLRQDPDVVMVGEIRDKETAEVAMKAAMTGHLVLSTLHTNDSASAITRLCDIGVEPYLIASTVTGIMAQRLLRLLCPHCKEAYQPPARALKTLFPHEAPDSLVTLYRSKGCPHCHGTGYWGRRGIFELLTVTEELRLLILQNAHSEAIRKTAQSQGLKTLRESGLEFVLQGVTTIEEVFRHTVD